MTSENKMREAQEALEFILDMAASSAGNIGGEEQVEHCGNIIRAALHSVEAEKESQWKASGYQYPVAMSHNPDAKAWADFFMAIFPNCGADPDIMLGWFANAMMAMHDHIVSEAEKEPEWLDINSAPKDRHILGCQSRHGIMRVVRGPIDEFGNWSTGPSSMDFLAEVTHWMELPAPPEHKPE